MMVSVSALFFDVFGTLVSSDPLTVFNTFELRWRTTSRCIPALICIRHTATIACTSVYGL